MNKRITTIIPTFRRPALLKKAILSVLDQTYPHFQVCIYDNASGDETEDVVREIMQKDPRVHYHRHPENIGMMANYLFALARIDTPYFSLLSDDDFLLPGFFETALKGFAQYPDAAFSACGVRAIDGKDQFISDPLSVWERDGYFAASEGVAEMIDEPLLPNGILFQHQWAKEVEIDASKEIQMRWDTDYLMQLAIRYPFVVNKQIEAVFLSHAEGFSTNRHRQMLGSDDKFFEHLDATDKIKYRALSQLDSRAEIKKQARIAFYGEFKRDVYRQMRYCIAQNRFSDARQVLSVCQSRYGFHLFFVLLLLRVWVFENMAFIVPLIKKMLALKKKLSSKI